LLRLLLYELQSFADYAGIGTYVHDILVTVVSDSSSLQFVLGFAAYLSCIFDTLMTLLHEYAAEGFPVLAVVRTECLC
jgi:hypothetical protein